LVVHHPRACIDYVHVINTENSSIGKWMDDVRILGTVEGTSNDHYVTMGCRWIENFLAPPDIVCCVVDACDIVPVHPIVFEVDTNGATIRPSMVVSLKFSLGPEVRYDSEKKVPFEFWQKIL
jgi:hypothetical protein